MSNLKTAVCTIGRLENRYAREFVEHYLKLGVDKIIVCDNNFGDEEHFEEVLQPYIDQGSVIIEDWRGVVKAQMRCYSSIYAKYGNEYDWIGYLDIDEFIVLEKHQTIQEFLNEKKDYECVLINWKCMSSNGLIEYENKPLMERFTEECPRDIKVQYAFPENMHVKSFVKGGLGNIKFYGNPHVPANNLLFCNADGVRCGNSPFQPITWETAYIKHFVTKSCEEYYNKLKRGVGDRDYNCFLLTYKGRFFKYNKPSKEQLDWFKQHNVDWI